MNFSAPPLLTLLCFLLLLELSPADTLNSSRRRLVLPSSEICCASFATGTLAAAVAPCSATLASGGVCSFSVVGSYTTDAYVSGKWGATDKALTLNNFNVGCQLPHDIYVRRPADANIHHWL